MFYPLHLVLLIFSEHRSRELIEEGLTMPAYLPVCLRQKVESCSFPKGQLKMLYGLIKEHHLRTLHECIETCFQPKAECALAELACKTIDGKN